MGEKNMVEDALFQIKNLEESLKRNAQGILSSTMRKEINSLVKESLMEQEEIEDPESAGMAQPGMEDPNMVEPGMEDPNMVEPEMEGGEEEMTGMEPEEDETIDMRGASDAEVIRVFKAMGDNDGVVVTRDNNIITLTDDDDEYIIKLNESMENFNETAFESSMDEELNEFGKSEYDMYSRHFGNDEEDMDYEEDEDDFSFEDEEDDDMGYEDEEDDDMGYEDEEEEIVYELEMNEQSEEDIYGDSELAEMYMDEQDEEDIYGDSELAEMYMDEEDGMDVMEMEDVYEEDGMDVMEMEDVYEQDIYESKSFKPKGRVGRLKKVDFTSNTKGGFNEKRKEAFGKGVKAVGTGKARFTYKDGENLDGDFRPIKKGKNGKKVETKEAARTYGNGGLRGLRKGITPNRNLKEEFVELRTKNNEYRKALDLFRTKLNEVAVFNSNLAYATRLFTEHSTTKQEKINILRRFDDVETLKESKNLYRVVKSELSNNSLIESVSLNESIERTVNKTASSGSAVSLIESKTYENPQFLRMKDLMGKL